MLGLLPRFLLLLQLTPTSDEGPQAWLPRQHATPLNDGTATSGRNFTERSAGVLGWLSSCGFAGIAALHQGRKPCPDRPGTPPGPAGRQRPVIRATHAGAA